MRKFEKKADLFQPRRSNACAGQQRLLSHFTEECPDSPGWRRKRSRPMKGASERCSEIPIRNGLRRNHVDRPGEILSQERMVDRLHNVLQSNPTPILLAGSESAT
jgi:hypothetical protein